MVFYQAWWNAWAVFVGTFVACISRGRLLREVVMYCVFAPVGFCLVWFTTWGGIGLRQMRQGKELAALGASYFNNSGHFLADGSEFCYDVPQEDVIVNGSVVFTNPGVTPVCQFDSANSNTAAFNVLNSFRFSDSANGGMGPVLAILFILGCVLFFVTSSDSATLVVDLLASNGRQNQHWARQSFWSVTLGALASVLLMSGGAESLKAVQAASIVCALPVVFLMCYMLQSIHLFCEADEKQARHGDYQFPDEPEFAVPIYGGVFNILEYVLSWGKVHPTRIELGMDQPTRDEMVEFAKGLVLPFVSLFQVLSSSYPQCRKINAAVVSFYASCYLGWVTLFFAAPTHTGLIGLKWILFIMAGCILAIIRSFFRAKYNLRSNGVGDLVSGIFFWPQVLAQMRLQGACSLSAGMSTASSSISSSISDPHRRRGVTTTIVHAKAPRSHKRMEGDGLKNDEVQC
jgi:BCCT, betaine/carnitine/choline family transporter